MPVHARNAEDSDDDLRVRLVALGLVVVERGHRCRPGPARSSWISRRDARRLRCETGFRRRLAERLGYGRLAEHLGDPGGSGGGKLVGSEVEPERSEDGLAVGVDVECGACSCRGTDDDESDTPVWRGGFDQPVDVVDGAGSCGDDGELPAGGVAEAELEGGRQPVPFEQGVVVATYGCRSSRPLVSSRARARSR